MDLDSNGDPGDDGKDFRFKILHYSSHIMSTISSHSHCSPKYPWYWWCVPFNTNEETMINPSLALTLLPPIPSEEQLLVHWRPIGPVETFWLVLSLVVCE